MSYMVAVQEQLESFHQFAQQKLANGGAESLEELLDLWRIENPTAAEAADVHAAIRQGLSEIQAGRGRDADEVLQELRRKYNIIGR